ncbi:retrotransposon protein, putative, ty1-copia subclass, partial [Tanacetum coccineum]
LNGGAVDWKSAKQSIFATSSAEAEYIAAFVRKFISGLGVVPTIEKPINMYCDNTGAIAIANESGITKGARHFRAKVHYLREVIEFGDIKLEKVHTDDNLADPFTKALPFPKHSELTRNIGMLPASRNMATTSNTDSSRQNKGKMIVAEEPEIRNVADLKSTDSNKTIEVIVYRKWISTHNQTRLPTKFCCMLIDKQGTPIQANMGVEDAEYFDQLLELHTAYIISDFSYDKTSPWERTLENDTSLIFGKYIQLYNIPNDDFPEHYFNFAAYNELARLASVKNTVVTGTTNCQTTHHSCPSTINDMRISTRKEQETVFR